MWQPLVVVQQNLSMSIENVILLIVILGLSIFYAKDFKLGIIMQLLLSASCFMGFYQLGWNYVPALVIMFITLVLLALSLFAVKKTVDTGGFI